MRAVWASVWGFGIGCFLVFNLIYERWGSTGQAVGLAVLVGVGIAGVGIAGFRKEQSGDAKPE